MTDKSLGPYQLKRSLCASAAGEVFLADDTQGSELVVRLLPTSIASDEERLERVFYDARAASGLDDPRIERTVDAGRLEGRAFLAAEPMGGESLADVLGAQKRLPAREVARIGLDLAEILARAHARGVSHRNLEPAHVYLVGEDRRVRLGGFGLAALFENAPATRGADAPSTAYLAPEQTRGEHADHRADFYALGAVLWAALGGSPPESPPDPKQLPDDAPPVLTHMLLELLAPDPGMRPAALSEVATGLREILAIPEKPPSVETPPPAVVEPAEPQRSRRPKVIAWAAGLSVIGGAIATGVVRLALRRKK